MTWPPVDSADARDQRHDERAPVHDPRCSGWLGEDLDGRLVPCLSCRPHLMRLPDGRIIHRATAHQRQEPTS